MKILLDQPDHRDALSKYFIKLFRSTRYRLWIVSPYVSPIKNLNFSKIQSISDVRCICDWKSTATDPRLVKKLHKQSGMLIRRMPDIHAKVFLTESAGMMGSGNFTQGGVGNGNIEAAIALTRYANKNELRRLDKWFLGLWEVPGLERVEDVSKEEWIELFRKYDEEKIRKGRKKSTKAEKLHFTDMLKDGTLENVFFCFTEMKAENLDRPVKKEADARKLPIPESWWQESDLIDPGSKKLAQIKRKLIPVNKKYCKCYNIQIPTKWDDDKNGNPFIKGFLRNFALRIFDLTEGLWEVHRGKKVAIVQVLDNTKPDKLTFSIADSAKNKQFLNILEKGLERNHKAWNKFVNTDEGSFGFCDLRTLKNVLLKGVRHI